MQVLLRLPEKGYPPKVSVPSDTVARVALPMVDQRPILECRYDAKSIRKWIAHMLWARCGFLNHDDRVDFEST